MDRRADAMLSCKFLFAVRTIAALFDGLKVIEKGGRGGDGAFGERRELEWSS